MPYGANESYLIRITRSQSDPSYETQIICITVPSTYFVEVADLDMSEEAYRGGDEPRTLRWKYGTGQLVDRYRLSFEHLDDVNVEVGKKGI